MMHRAGAYWIGVLTGSVTIAVVGLFAVPALGLFDMTATGDTGLLDWWGDTNWEVSRQWRSPDATLPATADADEGMEHFASMCLQCHGAPDVPRAEWANDMQPAPPELWLNDTQELDDGVLFHIIKGGVRLTGMPAFGEEHSDEDIWNMVAAVRGLNVLTAEQTQRLKTASMNYESAEHHGEAPGHEGAKRPVEDEAGESGGPTPNDGG